MPQNNDCFDKNLVFLNGRIWNPPLPDGCEFYAPVGADRGTSAQSLLLLGRRWQKSSIFDGCGEYAVFADRPGGRSLRTIFHVCHSERVRSTKPKNLRTDHTAKGIEGAKIPRFAPLSRNDRISGRGTRPLRWGANSIRPKGPLVKGVASETS